MNKSLGAAGTGFHDWYWQRISAALLLLLLPAVIGSILAIYTGNLEYSTLNQWFTHPLGKITSSLIVLALALHIWTGLKVIIEDYIHTSFGRIIVLNLIIILLLFASVYMLYHIWAELSYSLSCTPCNHGAR